MSPEKKIRQQAGNILGNNNWPLAVSAVLVILGFFLALMYLLSGADLLVSVFADTINLSEILGEEVNAEGLVSGSFMIPGMVLLIPVVMGVVRFFYLMAKGENVAFSDVFYYIGKKFFRSLGVFFGVFVRCLWQAAVCFLPSYIGLIILANTTADKEKLAIFDNIWYFIVYALLFGGILLFSKLCIRYFLYFFLYFEDENLSARTLCTLSAQYMQKFESSVMKLILSLFPWVLSCILIIPSLYAIPRVLTTLSVSAKWIILLHHQSENKDE